VGKKPPQSQKGGSHGLTPRMSAGLSPKEKINELKIKKIKKVGFPTGRRWSRGAPRSHLRPK
jgi:hypothetical protein